MSTYEEFVKDSEQKLLLDAEYALMIAEENELIRLLFNDYISKPLLKGDHEE